MSAISEQPMLAVRTFIAAGTGPTLFQQCTTAIQEVNRQLDGWIYTHHLTPAQLLHVTANTHFVFQGAQPVATHSLTVIYQPSGTGARMPPPDAPALDSSEPWARPQRSP